MDRRWTSLGRRLDLRADESAAVGSGAISCRKTRAAASALRRCGESILQSSCHIARSWEFAAIFRADCLRGERLFRCGRRPNMARQKGNAISRVQLRSTTSRPNDNRDGGLPSMMLPLKANGRWAPPINRNGTQAALWLVEASLVLAATRQSQCLRRCCEAVQAPPKGRCSDVRLGKTCLAAEDSE